MSGMVRPCRGRSRSRDCGRDHDGVGGLGAGSPQHLAAIRNSPPDQHVLEGFAIAPAKSAPAGAVYMIQHVDIAFRGFGAPVQTAFKALAGPSQQEAGALRYDVYEEPDPHLNHFSIVAAWTNEKAYEDHEAAPYTKQFRAAIAQTGKGNLYDQRIYKIVQ